MGLGRTGVSQQTRDLLDFQRAHAQARDAVHARLEAATLAAALAEIAGRWCCVCIRRQWTAPPICSGPIWVARLDEASRATLAGMPSEQRDLALVVADGLSALAVERHVPPLLRELLPRLSGWRLAPVCVVEQGRVAIGDEIGAALGALLCVVLIGERPGLSSPDSLGAYITWQPRPGRTDAERNCISNIRAEGLSYAQAAAQLDFYLTEARRRAAYRSCAQGRVPSA